MGKFTLNDILNSQSLAKKKPIFEIKLIHISKIKPSEANIYGMRGIEELADNIEMLGLLHNLDVKDADKDGMYEIISGERRYQACKLLYEAGNKDFEMIPCKVESAGDSDAISELKLLYANAATRELTDYEKTYQAGRIKELLVQMKKDGYEFKGRMRELVADMLNVSPAQVGRMEKINKNLSQEFKQEFEQGNIGITAAYELSGQSQKEQADTLDKYRKEGPQAIKQKPKPIENKTTVAAESQPANDCSSLEIKSREDAINALESLANRIERQSAVGRGEMVRTIRKAMEALNEKEAVWEEYQNKWGQINFRCSKCKKYHFHNGAMIREYKHCPGCGVKMKEGNK